LTRCHRHLAVTALLAIATLGAAPAAQAKDLQGRFGVGIEQSLAGVTGATVRYWPTQTLGINAIIGARIVIGTSSGGSKDLATTLDAALGVVYNLARSLNANLGLGARVGVGYWSKTASRLISGDDTASDNVQVNIEAPQIVLEFFLSDSFSFSVATGVIWDIVPAAGPTLDVPGDEGLAKPDTLVINLGPGSITGSLGIVYYF
jgi:hypothetical protein